MDEPRMKKERKEGLEMEVQWLKGVGPRVAAMLKKVEVETVSDALWYLPRRYEDRRNLPPIMMLKPGQAATVRGRLAGVHSRATRGGRVLLRANVVDDTGRVTLVWFNQPWVAKELDKVTGDVIAYGVVKEGERGPEIASPEWEAIDEDADPDDFARIVPVYPLVQGVPQWAVRRAVRSAVEFFANSVPDPLPEGLRRAEKLQKLGWCLRQMHLPESEEARAEARRRLVFEEFLYLQLMLQMRRQEVVQEVGISFPIPELAGKDAPTTSLFGNAQPIPEGGSLWDEVHTILPFDLTGAQRRVIDEIWKDMERPIPMNRLLQGDVGSGKTAVAACAMLAAVRCGYQAALMAPTEILAEQHYINLHKLFDPLGIKVTLLVGKQPAATKRRAATMTKAGVAQVCIGTHALIQEGVEFNKLGLIVIDEQHRFGVLQRAALRQKGYGHPDVLVMTATPIPRTLTMSLYGDLDLSVLDEMPPGRRPVKTHQRGPSQRDSVYEGVRKLIEQGRQAYFVCPMISDSEKMQTQAAVDLHYRLSTLVYPDLRVGLLHGQMKSAEKEEVMGQFRAGELDILVSTVVIEVGVDVPNATVMVIEDANRFGLSQLHQLRGRVGRGAHQSFCLLVADAQTEEARRRLGIMVATTDGFAIAEEDLKIRGPGDVAGTRQHGELDFKVADLLSDGAMLEVARQAAIRIIDKDPKLESEEYAPMLAKVREQRAEEALITVS